MRRLAAVLLASFLTACGDGGHVDRDVPPTQPPVEGMAGTPAFDDPAGLAFAANGDLWVANYTSSTVARYTPDALARSGVPAAATVIEAPALKGPNVLLFDAHGYLWVANYDGDTVVGFTPEDLVAGRAPSLVLPAPKGVLRKPAGLALDADGNLWVANARVGHLVRYPRKAGLEAGTARPDIVLDVPNEDCQGVAFHHGKLWLACSGIDRVHVYDLPTKSGAPSLSTQLDFPDDDACGPVALAPAPGDRLVAACYKTASVALLGKGGSVVGTERVHHQWMTNVHGVAYDSSGTLWAGTNYNVLAAYPPANPSAPSVLLRPA